jgi:hypothetical protein
MRVRRVKVVVDAVKRGSDEHDGGEEDEIGSSSGNSSESEDEGDVEGVGMCAGLLEFREGWVGGDAPRRSDGDPEGKGSDGGGRKGVSSWI